MINLDATTKSLQIILGGAITTNQLDWVSSFVEIDTVLFAMTATSSSDGVTNSGTAVTLVAAPAAGLMRQLKFLAVHNNDTVNATVTIRLNNNGTFRTIFKATLATLETIRFSEQGWQVFTSTGSLKNST
jgi:hypothetical protein